MEPLNAFIVHVHNRLKPMPRAPQDALAEAVALAGALGLEPVVQEVKSLIRPRANTYLGQGYVESLRDRAAAEETSPLIIINARLTPVQQRNLELATQCKVIDRTALILEIFAQRAISSSGQLQVELAMLTYQRSRLVRSWTHLERQRGGGGFLGGPGERQIELDRRSLLGGMKQIKKELRDVERTRRLQRQRRNNTQALVVVLIGYTNAGKSTLFNALTGATVAAQDKLFATLDPTMRRCVLASGREIVLSDTVGFISQLPTELIEAFKSTLEEVISANLLIHVHDAASAQIAEEAQDVFKVLRDIGLTESLMRTKIIHVLNKSDLTDVLPDLPWDQYQHPPLAISARTGAGLDQLLAQLETTFYTNEQTITLQLTLNDAPARAWLYRHALPLEACTEATYDEHGQQQLSFRISSANFGRFEARWPKLAQASLAQ